RRATSRPSFFADMVTIPTHRRSPSSRHRAIIDPASTLLLETCGLSFGNPEFAIAIGNLDSQAKRLAKSETLGWHGFTQDFFHKLTERLVNSVNSVVGVLLERAAYNFSVRHFDLERVFNVRRIGPPLELRGFVLRVRKFVDVVVKSPQPVLAKVPV